MLYVDSGIPQWSARFLSICDTIWNESESPRVGQVIRVPQVSSSKPFHSRATYPVSNVIGDIGIILMAFGRCSGPKRCGAAIIDLSRKIPLPLSHEASIRISQKSGGLFTPTSNQESSPEGHIQIKIPRMLDAGHNYQWTLGLFDIDSQMREIHDVYAGCLPLGSAAEVWSIALFASCRPKEKPVLFAYLNGQTVISFPPLQLPPASFVFLVNYPGCATWNQLSVSLSICWCFVET